MAKIRFGIIGVGTRGIRTFGRHLRGAYADRAELVALADLDPHRLGVAAKMLAVDKTYGSHSRLIQDAGVDAVVITTPDYTHTAVALEAMDAGKDIICEKPVATTLATCMAASAIPMTGPWAASRAARTPGSPKQAMT